MNHFIEFLSQEGADFVHVGYSGLMDDNFPALDQREFYIESIKNINAPVMIEKRTLLGKKKTVLSDSWRMLVPADYKRGAVLPFWAWFGAPPGNREDWA